MQVLNKYKKHFDKGFKEFVMKMDLLPAKVLKEILSNVMFEDPVYLKWALENRQGFESFLKLEKDDVYKVFRSINNPSVIFLRALKSHPEENNFINSKLPSLILKQYLEDREIAKITMAQQEDARCKIMQTIFDLKESGDLSPFSWTLPSSEVLSGTSHRIDNLGNYKQYYEGEILAITGAVEKGKRTGLWKIYYPNGSLHALGSYLEGQRQDEWSIYYLNGNLKSNGHYFDDSKNGDWKEFGLNNELKMIRYTNGKILSA